MAPANPLVISHHDTNLVKVCNTIKGKPRAICLGFASKLTSITETLCYFCGDSYFNPRKCASQQHVIVLHYAGSMRTMTRIEWVDRKHDWIRTHVQFNSTFFARSNASLPVVRSHKSMHTL
jgi:hypothetical protein